MEGLNEERIKALAEEYAESRMQYFKPWEGSYRVACVNAFINAYVAGYFAKCKDIDPDFEIPKEVDFKKDLSNELAHKDFK